MDRIAWRLIETTGFTKLQEEEVLHRAAWKLLEEHLQLYMKEQNHTEIEGQPKKDRVPSILEDIKRNSWNKPYLRDYPEIQFNLSHCHGMVACIISSKEVGIDIEEIRAFPRAVMKKVCSKEEQQWIEQSTCMEESFFRLWTLKESYIKAVGKGLSFPMKQVDFSNSLNGETNGKIHRNIHGKIHRKIQSNQSGYWFCQYILEKKYILSICVKD